MAIRFDGWSFWSYIELAIWRKRKVEVCRRTGIGEASHIIGVWPPLWAWYKYISSNLMTAQECDQTLPKAQQTYGLRAFIKIAAFKSCHKLVKIQLQNLKKNSASKSRPTVPQHQALTSRAFWLRVEFGSGLTKKFGFRVRVLCTLWS